MKTLLIVFVVLLFLLTLLSSFGGSIRPAEPFYDATPAEKMTFVDQPYSYSNPVPPRYDTFTTDIPPATDMYSMPPPPLTEPKTVQLLGGNDMMQKIDVPEPFVNDDQIAAGAPF